MSGAIRLVKELEDRGYAGRIVPIERLADLRDDIEAGRRAGLIDEALFREYLGGFVFGPPPELPGARSVIVVACRHPRSQFTFVWKGRTLRAAVPPTYLHAQAADNHVQGALAELLAPAGCRVAPAVLPKKLLAVRSGLAAYGRNNVAYVAGMGSYHRLSAFYTDLPPAGDDWRDLCLLERCESCRLCETRCPSGAIAPDRFRLHAERCLTFHNEKPWAVPFPPWMDPTGHNCLVGCMRCQDLCPENRGLLMSEDAGAFSEEETGLLLAGAPPERLPAALADKLEAMDLRDLLDVIPRNLGALLAKDG